ncbi:MAG: RecQ family ATP-dependent DNA helicase [Paludibacter sp.]|nr:RecQ family ATP-dependent DNA helicase [Bacteroidales bacterium]MCM1068899.1 RecQ family ATP-dependent DNA helicase [Prevotella sp.]MCM1353160.1 RecQ family ATP-dependent DNA helicase [Bacteroides sp.]MCM1442482.1 RecQ family ATP-dependent DNA helicase [Muribaculum sp.]MCM1481325.1 RecQ family ATP-dependent DNA helicase [Paludibacter sp.]
MSKYTDILRHYWGYSDFRPLQADIIESIGAGHDTLGLMPTGGGKSLCFQVPTLAQEGLCLVITPLVALMKDQVENLSKREIKAYAIYSGLTNREIQIILDNCQFGNYKFLYVSPERLESEQFRKRLIQLPICMIAVDEAHCISQWGYDFRPPYLRIAQIRKDLPEVPVLALTATATPDVVQDIQDRLSLPAKTPHMWNVFRKSFKRENLYYVVRHTDDKWGQLLHILQSLKGSAIVYVRNRQKTKETAEWLQQQGISATYYHAGLSRQAKDNAQRAWKDFRGSGDEPNEGVRVIVATNAFGMGIDKPDVRLVVHLDLPDTIEAYFQEAGRAGRDEQPAYAVLLYNKDDKTKAQKRVQDNYPTREFIKRVYESLGNWYEVGVGSGRGHTFPFPQERFCAECKLPLLPAYSAIRLLSQAGYLAYTEETESQPRVLFCCTREELYKEDLTSLQERAVHYLLRTYTGIFSDPVYVNDERMAKALGVQLKDLSEALVAMARSGILQYIPRRKTPYITFVSEREDLDYLHISEAVYENRKELYVKRLQAMVEYAEQMQFCRSQLLLAYFGETDAPPCGTCDVCRRNKIKEG